MAKIDGSKGSLVPGLRMKKMETFAMTASGAFGKIAEEESDHDKRRDSLLLPSTTFVYKA